MRGRRCRQPVRPNVLVFQSTPPCGGDGRGLSYTTPALVFQSTPPCGGDRVAGLAFAKNLDFNPRPLAGATIDKRCYGTADQISIHAPLRGRPTAKSPLWSIRHFNPRPLAGATWWQLCTATPLAFQSTPPCGGDLVSRASMSAAPNFNPRPLAGATGIVSQGGTFYNIFQSTPPCGGDATKNQKRRAQTISIHAPLRGRQLQTELANEKARFQSTPPCGGDVIILSSNIHIRYFNPRPLAGATGSRRPDRWAEKYFNPRPLAGATAPGRTDARSIAISIHAPLRGRLISSANIIRMRGFQSTPPCGGDS